MICKQCKKRKNEKDYYKNQGLKCKDCIKRIAREYKAKNKNRKKITDAKYYKNNKSVFIENNKRFLSNNPEYAKDYADKNKDRISIRNKKYTKEYTRHLSDYYVNSLYRKVNKINLDESLIPIKREQLKIKREIKKQNQ